MTTDTITRFDDRGIVTLVFDDPAHSVNTLDDAYLDSMDRALERLESSADEVRGVVLASAKRSFFAGADLQELAAAGSPQAGEMAAFATRVKSQLRRLETLGVPVVATLAGSALGGGLELALAAHHRIAVDDDSLLVGLPEVAFGLLPGGGGVVRTVRLLGFDRALDEVLLSGRRFHPKQALEVGLINELVTSPEALAAAARDWIDAHPDARQPWDERGDRGGGPTSSLMVTASLPARTAGLRASFAGAPMEATSAILSAAAEGVQVGLDDAFAIETRYFVQLACSQISTNLIQGTFVDRRAVERGVSRPDVPTTPPAERVAVIGAGMMGAGIALNAASAGLDVILKDVSQEAADRGKEHARKVLVRKVAKGELTDGESRDVLGRIHPVDAFDRLAGADVVIEAVFEDPELKADIFRRIIEVVAPDALLASNTSTLPITGLAQAVDRPEDFVGMHFFSPVERMDLLEIVVGELTSDATVARAFDLALLLGKTPIVVSDGRGFFTSRVILNRLLEAAAMVGEGVNPISIERASMRAGYPVGTLALLDELSLTLPHKIYSHFRAAAHADGVEFDEHPGDAVMLRMIDELGRAGRSANAGFYDYSDGRRESVWSGLQQQFGTGRPASELNELVDRLLFIESLDTARCLESGLLRSTADANIGSILGIGFPLWTGGAAQFVAGYPGGLPAYVVRAEELAERYGARFTPPASLIAAARSTSAVSA